MRMKDEDWDTVLKVNLESYFRLSRAALRGMMKARWGRIVGITSVVGVMGNPGQTNYCASKAGMIGFSKSLAQEVAARGVTVNCVAPGFIASPMTSGSPMSSPRTSAPPFWPRFRPETWAVAMISPTPSFISPVQKPGMSPGRRCT